MADEDSKGAVAKLQPALNRFPKWCTANKLRPEVSKKFKGLKLLVTVTSNLRIEGEVSKVKSILRWILSLISYTWHWCWFKLKLFRYVIQAIKIELKL